ncbi:winged helix-turn-helix transcriptional regulator [Apilactobacillus kunkeei]|uniref:MarR family winged helix-turn-helix transcriptional regulator n=1 Tax=Apilactobacillus kunkeei TaxID=148814 RepID=UPI001CDBC575|nr:MarR family winged helix-turn-helix transcriptional regulator [Apilactobacillus kunkeei]TMS99527.1 winged helix-turn-helix transcriptional regulator [Apilactobacillus kunkeei]
MQKNVFNSEISWAEARILMDVGYMKNPTPMKIAINLDLDKSYVSRVINKLNNLKYIEKKDTKKDKRTKLIYLTNTGKQVVEQLNINSDKQIQLIIDNLSNEEQESFYQSINTLNQLLEKGGINHVEN